MRLGVFVLLCALAVLPFTGLPRKLLEQWREIREESAEAGPSEEEIEALVAERLAPVSAGKQEVEKKLAGVARELETARAKIAKFEAEDRLPETGR